MGAEVVADLKALVIAKTIDAGWCMISADERHLVEMTWYCELPYILR